MNKDHPRLPQDIERSIFKMVAADAGCNVKSMAKLMLVAKRVCEWIRPILYEVFVQSRVFPSSAAGFPDFEQHPEFLKDVSKFAKHLFIGAPTSVEDINDLLLSCPNVENVALWYSFSDGFHSIEPYLEALRRLPLKRLSSSIRGLQLQNHNPKKALFLNLTHFHVSSFDIATLNHVLDLLTLPNLTHLCITASIGVSGAIDLLLKGPRLRVLVVFGDGRFDSFSETDDGLRDTRLVLLLYPVFGLYHDAMASDWERGARGGVDFWVLTERFSMARRNNFLLQVDNSQRWIPWAFPWAEELNNRGLEWYPTLLP